MSKPLLLLLIPFLFLSPSILESATTAAVENVAGQLFREAPQFYNSPDCPAVEGNAEADGEVDPDENDNPICSDHAVHVAMTLDTAYIRGSMAAILSVLQHSSCPQNVLFHFVASASANASHLRATISDSFPYLKFQIYPFDDSAVSGLISTSIRSALDCPLNYARSYLADLLPICVRRVVYLDSDLILVDDIAKLAATELGENSVLAAPEYCNANFTSYFVGPPRCEPALPIGCSLGSLRPLTDSICFGFLIHFIQ
jgi:hypothetical protein